MTVTLVGHVISLERRTDRRQRFLGWNGGHGIEWVWHPAAEPTDVDRSDADIVAGPDVAISDAEIAAALSHRRQWQACVADNAPRLIFEDDACARRGCAPMLTTALKFLATSDLVFFGCNTDADIVLELPDHLFSHVTFGNTAHSQPGYFDSFALKAPPCPAAHLYRTYLTWGLLAYAVSPVGAAKLLRRCFPLRRVKIELFQQSRKISSAALDGQINAALQSHAIKAMTCFPPLVVGPNGDSDLDPRKNTE